MLKLRLAVVLAAALCMSCSVTPWKRLATGYNFVSLTKTLGEKFDSSVKKFLEVKRAECKAAHAIKTAEYDKCVLPAVRLSRAWTGEKAGKKTGKGGLGILQAGQRTTKLALDAAFDYVKTHEKACSGEAPPKDCHGDWKVLIKPGICAAWTVVDLGVKIGAFKTTDDPTYKLVAASVDAFACGR
ncbi:MAG: hypothetical protein GY838_13320 [bacterium]|nr:hypothetical protein [bacterium]